MTTMAQVKPLEIPDQFSNVFGLGVPQAVYATRKGTKWTSAVVAFLFIVGSGLVFIFGLFSTYNTYTDMQALGPMAVDTAQLLTQLGIFLIAAAVLFLIGAGAAWSAYSGWKRAALVYSNGLAYADRHGIRTWRWDQFDSIKSAVTKHYSNGIYTGTTHVYTLLKADGDKIVLNDGMETVEELLDLIRSNVFPLLYQRTSAAYNSGQPVQFGPITLSRADGIQLNRKSYPWDQVASVSIQQGFIKIAKKDGGWFSGASIAAYTVPNLEVMLSIVDQVIGLNVGK